MRIANGYKNKLPRARDRKLACASVTSLSDSGRGHTTTKTTDLVIKKKFDQLS